MGVQVRQKKIFGNNPKFAWEPMMILFNGTPIEDLSGINSRSLTGVQIIKGGLVAETMLEVPSSKFGILFLTMKAIPNEFIKPDRPPGFLQQNVADYTYATASVRVLTNAIKYVLSTNCHPEARRIPLEINGFAK